METITNAASAASRAIFGETESTPEQSGREPLSGEMGDTSKGEPYDAGNTGCKSQVSYASSGRLQLIHSQSPNMST